MAKKIRKIHIEDGKICDYHITDRTVVIFSHTKRRYEIDHCDILGVQYSKWLTIKNEPYLFSKEEQEKYLSITPDIVKQYIKDYLFRYKNKEDK